MKPGDVVGDRFELVELAGSGGMGAVFRARDRFGGDQVAVKVMRPTAGDLGDRFAREIRVLAQLRHPGIVRHVADGVTNGEMWLAMEWLEGEPLGSRIRRTGITATDAVQVVRRVAEALGAAHERGVVHRDVKPSNLFVVRDDLARVKLLDFGVARISDGERFSTRTGVMIGTPGYMAPEQARGDREVGPRADVFSLGCVLFELLTGQHAFVGDNVMAVLAKILLEDAPRMAELRPDLPHVLDELLAQVLSKDPADRPADGGQLAAALGALGELDALDAASAVAPKKALTTSERRLLSVILLRGEPRDVDTFAEAQANEPTLAAASETPPTLPGQPAQAQLAANLAAAAHAHGAMLDRLIDGSYVVTLTGSGTASDMAMQAARCALALHAAAPDVPIALATGRGMLAGKWPVGEAIDRAARFLGTAQGIRIDDVTAGLLDTRFELGGDAAGLVLVGEREITETARTLLGKPTPCVGRDRELGVLMGLWDECVAEPMARAVVVVGVAGIGKSRIRVELLRKLAGQPCEVWIGRGDPLKVGSPYGMIAPALRRAAGIRDGEPVEVRRHKLRARFMRNTAVATEPVFLAELIGAPHEDDAHAQLRAARQDPLLMAELIRQAFVQFAAVEAAMQPLVIVFEDLHWGDLASVKLIDAVLRELADRPVFVLALARPEVHDAFPRLWNGAGAQVIRLDELTRKGSERLVRGVLGDRASDVVVARLVEQAAGNAFYLEELIRATAEGKGDALPETVLAVVTSRLERLELDARRVLRAAAVFGARFWQGGVLALLGEDARRTGTQDWLDVLVDRELIARVPASRFPAEREYQFRHSIVREAAYAMLTDADRKLGHQLAGEWLAEAGEGDPLVLADHFDRAGDHARAAGLFRAAAEQAMAASEFRTAIALVDRAEAAGATAEPRFGRAQTERAFVQTDRAPRTSHGELALLRAEAYRWLGEAAPAAKHAHDALLLLRRDSAELFAAIDQAATADGKLGRVTQLQELAALLERVPRSRDTLGARVIATANLAFQLFSFGNQTVAQTLLDDVERAAPDVADEPLIMARIYQARSSRSMMTGDAGAYLESERAAFRAFEQAGDLRNACVQRGYVGYACLEIGAYAEAEEALRDALARAETLNLASVVATAKHNLGRALAALGNPADGVVIELQAVAAFAAQGDRRFVAGARLYCGMIYYELGDFAAAEREVRAALDYAPLPMKAQIGAALARVMLATGRREQALAEARGAMAILESLSAIEEGEAMVRLVLAECLLNVDVGEARAVLAVAREKLLVRASLISDAGYRKSFLERIADHARTIDLAARI